MARERGLAGMLATRREQGRSTTDEVEEELSELYGDELPDDALGREARTLASRGSLYLGAGVGASKKQKGQNGEEFIVTQNDKEVGKHDTSLAATSHAYKLAGGQARSDTPGGEAKITDPAVAARVRELDGLIATSERRIANLSSETSVARRTPIISTPDDNSWRVRDLARERTNLRRYRAEQRVLLGKATSSD